MKPLKLHSARLFAYSGLAPQTFFFPILIQSVVAMQRYVGRSPLGYRGSLTVSRRFNFLNDSTKGQHFMKHLDLYARRDVQLAPYLLREVDIEYKRKCRKVNFLVWLAICTVTIALQTRLQGETLHYMRLYSSYVRAEQDAKDEDNIKRRQVFVYVMNVVKDAFDRDQVWRNTDEDRAIKYLEGD